jgi:hypothetical protein
MLINWEYCYLKLLKHIAYLLTLLILGIRVITIVFVSQFVGQGK